MQGHANTHTHAQPAACCCCKQEVTSVSEWVLTCADEAGAAAVDQVVVIGQDERTALLDLQAVLVARYPLLTGLLGGGEILSAEPGLIGRLRRKKKRREGDINRCWFARIHLRICESCPALVGLLLAAEPFVHLSASHLVL